MDITAYHTVENGLVLVYNQRGPHCIGSQRHHVDVGEVHAIHIHTTCYYTKPRTSAALQSYLKGCVFVY